MSELPVVKLPIPGNLATEIWISEAALKVLVEYQKASNEGRRLVKRLERYAQSGFGLYSNSDKSPIRLKWDEVYAIQHSDSLFRLIGFFGDDKTEFVVVSAYMKSDRRMSAAYRELVNKAATIRKNSEWKKS